MDDGEIVAPVNVLRFDDTATTCSATASKV